METKIPNYVFRFLPVNRLLEIIENNEIIFSRNKKWDDPLEGFFLKYFIETENNGPHAFPRDVNYSNFVELRFYLCCTKNKEKDYQWKYYAPDKDGVRIKLSVSDLLTTTRSLLKDIEVRPIQYVKLEEFIDTLLKFKKKPYQIMNHLLFFKREEFSHEREFRFLIQTSNESDYLPVKIDPKRAIKEILFDPRMDRKVFDVYSNFIKQKWPWIQVELSDLYDPDRAIKKMINIPNS